MDQAICGREDSAVPKAAQSPAVCQRSRCPSSPYDTASERPPDRIGGVYGPLQAAKIAIIWTIGIAVLLHWLNHGQHLTAIAAYRYEISAGADTNVYLFMLIWFPVIGLIMSALGAACTPLGRPAPSELTPVPAMPGNQ